MIFNRTISYHVMSNEFTPNLFHRNILCLRSCLLNYVVNTCHSEMYKLTCLPLVICIGRIGIDCCWQKSNPYFQAIFACFWYLKDAQNSHWLISFHHCFHSWQFDFSEYWTVFVSGYKLQEKQQWWVNRTEQ